MKKLIKVVGAIIENENYEILCALRSIEMSLSNHWEFPGGKIEAGESIADTIVREIKEELDCTVEFIETFNENTHEYEKYIVNLTTVKCRIVEGTPTAREHACLLWLKKENMPSLKWAPADIPAVELLISQV